MSWFYQQYFLIWDPRTFKNISIVHFFLNVCYGVHFSGPLVLHYSRLHELCKFMQELGRFWWYLGSPTDLKVTVLPDFGNNYVTICWNIAHLRTRVETATTEKMPVKSYTSSCIKFLNFIRCLSKLIIWSKHAALYKVGLLLHKEAEYSRRYSLVTTAVHLRWYGISRKRTR